MATRSGLFNLRQLPCLYNNTMDGGRGGGGGGRQYYNI